MDRHQRKLVSVIMGVYNSNPIFLRQSVQSILNQTYKNFELIICNDGSDDDTQHALELLADTDSRIRILTNSQNFGLAYTLNHCIQETQGEYIARMDDDDVSLPNRLEEQVGFLEDNPQIMFVGSNIAYIDDNGNVRGKREMPSYPQKKDFLMNSPYVHPSVMFRKEIFMMGNYYSNKKIFTRVEDYEFWMRCHYQGIYGANLQKVLLYYREDTSGLKKRLFKYRLHEMMARFCGFYELGILSSGFFYIWKPLLVAIIPKRIVQFFHRRY